MLRARMTRSLCTMLPQLLLQARPWKSSVFWLILGLNSSQTGGLSHHSQLPCQSEPFVNYLFEHCAFDTEDILGMVEEIARQHNGLASFLLKKIDLRYTINFGKGGRSKLLCGAVAGGFEDLLDILLSARTSVLKDWNCDAGHKYIMCIAIASGNIRMI
ncbi:unnamed protein product [Penicillium nalgiovense]|uniref:Uncharacterized protein n=1 Tax=Penicillium nalgiovense TaxID=60175 RepID=A0A9W4IS21_PENNA|nr:unnamed protein product [Penicillium nalgiovense]CAG7946554.1 unnamed protein product [Penicillium nalgiovense]CAG7954152.1 unnamed protein product [Penicillium nalgiovense]CAG7962678.1 unnamed protein product [Penicillium nalgiovense]CAG7991212.1 unnamed protein product [Penicillium nalgiovense]